MNQMNLEFLNMAVEQAKKSVEMGGFPAGAVVVKNGKVISRGVSLGFLLNDPTSHAETASIREACKKLKTVDLSGAVLYASLQPCMMCFFVANWAGIGKIVYGCRKTNEMVKKGYYAGNNNIEEVNRENNRQMELLFLAGVEDEMLALIKEWEEKQGETVRDDEVI